MDGGSGSGNVLGKYGVVVGLRGDDMNSNSSLSIPRKKFLGTIPNEKSNNQTWWRSNTLFSLSHNQRILGLQGCTMEVHDTGP